MTLKLLRGVTENILTPMPVLARAETGGLVHPRTSIQDQDELSSLLQVPIVVRICLTVRWYCACHPLFRICVVIV